MNIQKMNKGERNTNKDEEQLQFMRLMAEFLKSEKYQYIYNTCRMFVISGCVELSTKLTTEEDFEKLHERIVQLLNKDEESKYNIKNFIGRFIKECYKKVTIQKGEKYCETCGGLVKKENRFREGCGLEFCYHKKSKNIVNQEKKEVYMLDDAFYEFIRKPGLVERDLYIFLIEKIKKMKKNDEYKVVLFPNVEKSGDVGIEKEV